MINIFVKYITKGVLACLAFGLVLINEGTLSAYWLMVCFYWILNLLLEVLNE